MGRKLWMGFRKLQFMIVFVVVGAAFVYFSGTWNMYAESLQKIRLQMGGVSGQETVDAKEEPFWGKPEQIENQPDEEAALPEAVAGMAADLFAQDAAAQEAIGEPEEKTFHAVPETYFDDALFIGDSRTVGMKDYGKFGEGTTFYASTGLTIFKLFTAEIVEQEGQRRKLTIEEALGQRQFAKIYLMVGINELGTGDAARFERAYREAVEHIRELQPDAIIYIQSILKVTQKRSEKGDYITNEGIIERNDAIRNLADNRKIFWLDVNEAVCDESGAMDPQYTTDGVHLKAKYIPLWKEFLQNHAIE